jgi:hypothetical protein
MSGLYADLCDNTFHVRTMCAIRWSARHGSRCLSFRRVSSAPEGSSASASLLPIVNTAAAFKLALAAGATAASNGLPFESMPYSIHVQLDANVLSERVSA